MSDAVVDQIANAVLYEGYLLYPYRPGVKNRQRWTFGSLLPRAFSEAHGNHERWQMQTQCLVASDEPPDPRVRVRCLQPVNRAVGELHEPVTAWPANTKDEPPYRTVDALAVAGRQYQPWQEAVEREIAITPAACGFARTSDTTGACTQPFTFPAARHVEPLRNDTNQIAGVLVREQQAIEGVVELLIESIATDLHRLTVRVRNDTHMDHAIHASRDDALMHALASTHIVLNVARGAFVSLMDPPEKSRDATDRCDNRGCWPVLVGEEGRADTMLASPIILYDYPRIAPQSPGDLFDGTEIDELLSLRIMTLTDEEKRAAAATDDRARTLIERTESLAREQLANLHGTMQHQNRIRNPESEVRSDAPTVHVNGVELKPGDRVQLDPKGNADAFDVVLRGMSATIESIERDYENRIYLAVSVDADPGADYGQAGQPGHRFFFSLEDVAPLPAERPAQTHVKGSRS